MSTSMESTTQPSTQGTSPTRRIVDAPVRMFHALSALCFTGAWLTADSESWRNLHITLGYTLAGLLLFRLLYGLIGPRQARLSLWQRRAGLWRSLLEQLSQPTKLFKQGQQWLMAMLIIMLLLLIIPVTLSGYLANNNAPEWVAELHEVSANLLLTLVIAHIGLVLLSSLLRKKNLAGPMVTGRIRGSGPDLARRNHAWLALLMLAVTLGYGTYAWQQGPQSQLSQRTDTTSSQGEQHEEHD